MCKHCIDSCIATELKFVLLLEECVLLNSKRLYNNIKVCAHHEGIWGSGV
jgi:hypothetical protein